MSVCDQPVGRGLVADNRRCGALCVEGWRLCAAHLSHGRATLPADRLERFRVVLPGGDDY
jgi:hypothetical protein